MILKRKKWGRQAEKNKYKFPKSASSEYIGSSSITAASVQSYTEMGKMAHFSVRCHFLEIC